MWGDVRENPIGIVVGEYPGFEDVESSRVFVGQTGREFDAELLSAGLSRQELTLCNSTLCRPKPGQGSAAFRAAAQCCRPALLHQLSTAQPTTPTLAMGKLAVFALTGQDKGAMSRRGFIDGNWRVPNGESIGVREAGGETVEGIVSGAGIETKIDILARESSPGTGQSGPSRQSTSDGYLAFEGGLVITWSPSFAFFGQPYEWGTFSADLARFARLVRGTTDRPPTVNLDPTVEDLLAFLECPFVACDIETAPGDFDRPWTGKDPTQARLKTIAFGTAQHAVAVEWVNVGQERHVAVARLLADMSLLKIFHNGTWFDIRVLERYGMTIRNYMDTRDMRRVLVSTSKLSLQYVASVYTDFPAWKHDDE